MRPDELRRPLRLSVRASAVPDVHLLRSAMQARLEGRPFPAGAESQVADAVVAAVRARQARSGRGSSPC